LVYFRIKGLIFHYRW